jgi:hypothetical protein
MRERSVAGTFMPACGLELRVGVIRVGVSRLAWDTGGGSLGRGGSLRAMPRADWRVKGALNPTQRR